MSKIVVRLKLENVTLSVGGGVSLGRLTQSTEENLRIRGDISKDGLGSCREVGFWLFFPTMCHFKNITLYLNSASVSMKWDIDICSP